MFAKNAKNVEWQWSSGKNVSKNRGIYTIQCKTGKVEINSVMNNWCLLVLNPIM